MSAAESPKKNRVKGIFYISAGLLMLIAFLGYQPEQCPWINSSAMDRGGSLNPLGISGTYLSFAGLSLLGLAYVLLPIFLIRAGATHLSRKLPPLCRGRVYGMICALLTLPIFLAQLQQWFSPLRSAAIGNIFLNGMGGWLGTVFYEHIFLAFLGNFGTTALLLTLLGFSLWNIFTVLPTLSEAIEYRLEHWGSLGNWLMSWRKINLFFWWRRDRTPPLGSFAMDFAPALQAVGADALDRRLPLEEERVIDDALLAMKKQPLREKFWDEDEANLQFSFDCYVYPTLELLNDDPAEEASENEHMAMAEALKETLKQFGIGVEIGEIQSGPVITRFELLPAPGVRVEKIENLDKNIALTLRAPSVRILAPIPGRNGVGIEIPNSSPKAVSLKSILRSSQWENKTTEIPIVLGKTVTGEPLIADLARMPHLLIAGSTGSGKTVCINSILASFLYYASPEDLRLILVDPKIVEMQVYNRLPHMLLPTLTDPKKVPAALKWLIHEMEWRYHLFASLGVRNIGGFNAKVSRTREEVVLAKEMERAMSPEERAAMANLSAIKGEKHKIPQRKLPYIVCVIDELADLMLVAPDDIENSVTRLAQLARAAGIHLILATQRPSVNVITGVIKANLPSRIAFKVASKVDSRTILDGNGADSLIGRGDMLFMPPGASTLVRAQGAWVSDDEINRVVEFISKNGPPRFDKDAMAFLEESGNSQTPPNK